MGIKVGKAITKPCVVVTSMNENLILLHSSPMSTFLTVTVLFIVLCLGLTFVLQAV